MRRTLGSVLVLLLTALAFGADPKVVAPYESGETRAVFNPIDELNIAVLKKHNLQPAALCSDKVFVRRVYLDVIGTLPEGMQVLSFVQDARQDKRARLIDALLERKEFADYQAMKWCDVLRVKAEFPINLWPNAVQAYHRWLRDSIRRNMPYDQFARELLTSSGSNFRTPPANFYRAMQGREPATIAEAVGLTFMGTRLASWPTPKREQMAVFFSRIAYKQTAEWKEEIVCLNPAPAKPLDAVLPDNSHVQIGVEQDPRFIFADWLISPKNEWFARAIVNRMWSWLLGRGIIHEPDDIRPDNPPVNPELLAYLQKELIGHKYDLKHLYRLILNSRTYQQSSIPRGDAAQSEKLFACYPVRRLEAEVLIDAFSSLFGGGEGYSSAIPEPIAVIPEQQRTIELADASVTSQFLEMFGRPARDTGLESERNNAVTADQSLHLLNSSHVQKKIEGSWRLRQMIDNGRGNRPGVIRKLYLHVLSRFPTDQELQTAERYFNTRGNRLDQAANDLVWALVNSKEFLYRH